ncbi:M48 family metallopeptidase [Sutcliffiella horikoshii]|uniref:M48 family metallopeptidase n=1 Tax=Sutcliffiella horikoshii TaxID=79883 RepID=UPI003CEA4B78
MIHTYSGETMHFEIKYKNRKSIAIRMDVYGNVEVQAPKGTEDEKVIRLLEERWELIQEKSKEMKDRLRGQQEKEYSQEERVLYLGNTYPVKVYQDNTIEQDYVVFDEKHLNVYVKQVEDGKIKQALKRFYYQQCKAIVEKSVKSYQSNFKVKPRSIRISDSKTTWGTCDSQLQLTFNWKLAMAPMKVIDYVVVHEMCHMIHLNHDRSFWRLVGKISPDYKEQESWLAQSSWKMTI